MTNIGFQLDDKTFTLHETSAAAAEAAADRAEAAVETVEGVPAIIAPAFSESTTYASGDYVIYSGKLYQFIADHSAGVWTWTDVETTTVAEKLDTSHAKTIWNKEQIALLEEWGKKVIYKDGTTGQDALNALISSLEANIDQDERVITVIQDGTALVITGIDSISTIMQSEEKLILV